MIYYYVHSHDPDNCGDMFALPILYFNLPTGEVRDIHYIHDVKEGVCIIGGGGMFHFDHQMRRLCTQFNGKLIGWGIGSNHIGFEIKYPAYAKRFSLLGVRDWNRGYQWTPCASCMSSLFDNSYAIENDYVVYEHYDNPINLDFPKMKNTSRSLQNVLQHLGSGETVITNSYHGAYWALLLGRKAMLWRVKETKFYGLRWYVPIIEEFCNRGIAYPESLAQCRTANTKFAIQVRSELDIEL